MALFLALLSSFDLTVTIFHKFALLRKTACGEITLRNNQITQHFRLIFKSNFSR